MPLFDALVRHILPLFWRGIMGNNGFQVSHYGLGSVLASLGGGCFAASMAIVASIGEKWYYFGATSTLGHSGPPALVPSGHLVSPL